MTSIGINPLDCIFWPASWVSSCASQAAPFPRTHRWDWRVGLLWEKLTWPQPTCTVPTSARAQWQPCRPGHGVISRLAHFPEEARAAARESPHSARASRSWEPGFWPRLLTRSSKGDPFYLGILPVCSTCFCLTHWGKIEHLWGEWRICYSQGLFRSLLTCYMC